MYDIILWGATGFTGKQAARYLHEQYGKKGLIKWAIAGRDRNKLEAIRNKIGAHGVPIFIVSGGDAAAADEIAKSTKVVCSTIAPAALYASEMVAACVKYGTDYCDLSGELHWLRKMIDQHDNQAQASGSRIINACGFDSIPSDLGVQMLQEQAYQEHGEYCHEIKNCFAQGKIAVSGGSFESGKGVMLAVANDPALASLISDPHCLNPRDKMQAAPTQEIDKVLFDKDFNQFIMPFPIGGINSRIVRRSHALNDFKYGRDFIYREAKLAGRGVGAKIKAELETRVTKLFVEGDPNKKFTQILHSLGPKPGSGPSDEEISKNGPFSFVMVGKTPSGKSIRGYVYSDWDPGHGGTSAMLADTAYCLAMEREKTGKQGGFSTTSVALGNVLRKRLENHAKIHFGIGVHPAIN